MFVGSSLTADAVIVTVAPLGPLVLWTVAWSWTLRAAS